MTPEQAIRKLAQAVKIACDSLFSMDAQALANQVLDAFPEEAEKKLPRVMTCRECVGTGYIHGHVCWACKTRGVIETAAPDSKPPEAVRGESCLKCAWGVCDCASPPPDKASGGEDCTYCDGAGSYTCNEADQMCTVEHYCSNCIGTGKTKPAPGQAPPWRKHWSGPEAAILSLLEAAADGLPTDDRVAALVERFAALEDLAVYVVGHPQAASGRGDKEHAEWQEMQRRASQCVAAMPEGSANAK